MKKDKLLYEGSEWSFEKLEKTWAAIDEIGSKQLGFDYYPAQIEVISAEQMIDAYSSNAMPIMYNHWSFGKTFIQNDKDYKAGKQGLAYEVVINTNPSIAYLMETNSMTMQALVLAHASVGHSSFFKTNYLFREWSDADSILDYLKFARKYISDCEHKYGAQEVEELLDACHSLQLNGVDKYKKPRKKGADRKQQMRSRLEHEEEDFNDVWRTLPKYRGDRRVSTLSTGVEDMSKGTLPEENILYFIEKYSPVLKDWEREVVRIVRKISQYFYPQRQTALMNEGWACLNHHTIMNMLYDQGRITSGSLIEALQSHSGVVYQPEWDDKRYSGINVYALGFAMMSDIKRMCSNPDAEDKQYFPHLCNTDWRETTQEIVRNYRDESFVMQFLSPKVARQFNLFSIDMDENLRFHMVANVDPEEDLLNIRKVLSAQYDLSKRVPHIEIVHVDWEGDRTITLHHYTADEVLLNHEDLKKTAAYLHQLWGHTVKLEYKNHDGKEDV